MGADEEGTLATLKAHREAVTHIVQGHGGRIVGTAGDSLLLEFPSVIEAVLCAVEVQPMMAERNVDVPDDRKMLYRIGINLGDVMIDGDDIYGDGVNIAARLEGLANAGHVCISQTVLETVRDRIDVQFDDLGEVEVKNITRPVRVWRWSPAGQADAGPAEAIGKTDTLPSPDQLSIAVLPFANISDDKEQEYFADGMTDDLITDLSNISGLIVIARNSVFTYKGKNVKVQEVAKDLNVTHVLQGSVRRAGGKVRINAQLINAGTGTHLWAETFDRDFKDIFQLQDDVAAEIVAALKLTLTLDEKQKLATRPTENLEAYETYLRARQAHLQLDIEGMSRAPELYEKAIDLDPTFAAAYAGDASVAAHIMLLSVADILNVGAARERSERSARRALNLNPNH